MAEATKVFAGGISAPSGVLIRGAHPRVPNDGQTTDLESGPIRSIEVLVPTASVLLLNSVAFELVPAVTGKVMQVLAWALVLDYNSIAYTGGGACAVYNGTILMSATIAAAFVQGSADAVKVAMGASDVVSAKDAALTLKCATAEFAAGNSPLRVKLIYAAHDHGL